MSKKKTPINWEDIGKMFVYGASVKQVARCLNLHPDTLYTRCSEDNNMTLPEFRLSSRSIGEIELLKSQFETALDGNTTLLIWLGKNRLGQTDSQQMEIDEDSPLVRLCKMLEDKSNDPTITY